ncbi:TPA: glycosyltransferase family 4 protein [Citrobacter freundii]|nr:glycosyltransferase family 4 protein [Citrobacter freundii]HCA7954803.1 glycosyltransferase family 4 protein [Citrobacter freundii]
MKSENSLAIAHVQVIPKMSGSQRVSLDILQSICDDNIKKYIICGELSEQSKEFETEFSNSGVEVISIPSLKRNIGFHDVKAFFDLYKFFKTNKIDIVHTNSTKPAIIARIAAKLAGVKKIVHTIHGIAFHKHNSLPKRVVFWCLEYFSAWFGDVNISVNNYYKKYYPLIKTQTIYNGVNFNKFNVSKTESDSIHFAFMARLDEQKNPLEFLEAIRLFKKAYNGTKKIKFSLAGNGPLMSICIDELLIKGIYEDVKVYGWVTDKNQFLNTVDVVCQPSKWEAFGLIFVESAFFNIPSIGKNVEGIPEVICDNETGMVYNGGAAELCKCMLLYANNEKLLQEHGNKAREMAISKFNVSKMVSQYKKTYEI